MKRKGKGKRRRRIIIEFPEIIDPHNGTAWDNLYDPEDDAEDPIHQDWHDHPVRDLFDDLYKSAEEMEVDR